MTNIATSTMANLNGRNVQLQDLKNNAHVKNNTLKFSDPEAYESLVAENIAIIKNDNPEMSSEDIEQLASIHATLGQRTTTHAENTESVKEQRSQKVHVIFMDGDEMAAYNSDSSAYSTNGYYIPGSDKMSIEEYISKMEDMFPELQMYDFRNANISPTQGQVTDYIRRNDSSHAQEMSEYYGITTDPMWFDQGGHLKFGNNVGSGNNKNINYKVSTDNLNLLMQVQGN